MDDSPGQVQWLQNQLYEGEGGKWMYLDRAVTDSEKIGENRTQRELFKSMGRTSDHGPSVSRGISIRQ